jgi:hypothetical protein
VQLWEKTQVPAGKEPLVLETLGAHIAGGRPGQTPLSEHSSMALMAEVSRLLAEVSRRLDEYETRGRNLSAPERGESELSDDSSTVGLGDDAGGSRVIKGHRGGRDPG